jgi:hypothetical protein
MIDVTFLRLDPAFSSTVVGPMEVFRHAGSLWNHLAAKLQEPRFHVTVASADSGPVLCDSPIRIHPMTAIHNIRKTDMVFIPPTGLRPDDVVERNSAFVPRLKQWHKPNGRRETARWPICQNCGSQPPSACSRTITGKSVTLSATRTWPFSPVLFQRHTGVSPIADRERFGV